MDIDGNPYSPPASIVTPDSGAAASLAPAGVWIRIGAMLLDFIVLIPLSMAGVFLSTLTPGDLGTVVSALTYPLYKVITEGVFSATPGKMIVRVKILDRDGLPIGLGRAAARHVTWLPSLLTSLASVYVLDKLDFESENMMRDFTVFSTVATVAGIVPFIGCLVALTNPHKRALHDYIAGTFCVRTAPRP